MAFLNRDYYYMPYAAGSLSFLTVPAPNMQPQQLVPPGVRDQSDSESVSLDAWFAAAPHQVAPTLPRPYSSQLHSPAIYKPADRCTMQCCAPAPSSVPVYNASPAYSLASAGAGAVPVGPPAPKPVRLDLLPGPAPPPLRPVAYTPALHGKWANSEYQAFSETVCYSPDVPRASSAASAGEEYFYEPESTGGSNLSVTMCSSEVPPPKAAAPPIKKERPHSSSARAASHAFSPSARISKPQRSQPRDNSRVGSESGIGTSSDAPPPPEYTCDICSAVFIRKHDVERHRRSHTGERPFPCLGGCGKAFRRADARARHWGVYRECEWRHARLLEGTPEGARRERRLLKRAKRAELVQLGVARAQIDLILKKM